MDRSSNKYSTLEIEVDAALTLYLQRLTGEGITGSVDQAVLAHMISSVLGHWAERDLTETKKNVRHS